MKKRILESCKRSVKNLLFPVPARLSKNHIQIGSSGFDAIEQSMLQHYYTGWRSRDKYCQEAFDNDLNAHLHQRLESDRSLIVPWLDNAAPLRGMRILEIGCGTGSSTVALAEQGARITAIDIDDGALSVAMERTAAYGVQAEFRRLNAEEISGAFEAHAFDAIIFFACLEHMTITERLTSLRQAWEMLPAGGVLVVVETPNRLWYFDDHTSLLPFFHWLPDELAFQYSRFSGRENFRELYRENNQATHEHFLRRGSGVSFHEFELALGPAEKFNVVSSLSSFLGIRHRLKGSRLSRRYRSLLLSVAPGLHEGFFDDNLYLIIKKR